MKHFFYSLLIAILISCSANAQSGLSSRIVKDNLFIPWEIIYGPDDRIWFTQKDGYVCRLEPVSGQLDTIYFEAQNVIRGEGGMLGMAIHPSFPNDPYVFLAYQYENEDNGYIERIVKYTYANNTLINPQVLLDDITGADNHNGCRLMIVEDKLFVTTGDAQNTALSQDVNSVNGKVLRINLDGSIPADNPIPGSPVWSWGHRNAQGLVHHNGMTYISEHGPNNDDEINAIQPGRNYGWPNVQGFCNTPAEMAYCADSNIVEPLYAWTPTIAVGGMAYYNHPMFPQYANSLLMATLKDGKLYKVSLNAAGDSIIHIASIPGIDFGRLRDVAVAPDGRIFISTSNSNSGGSGPRIDKIVELYDSTTTGLYPRFADNGALMIYPNPAMDIVNVAFLDNDFFRHQWDYRIDNIQGQSVQKGTLELSSIPVGSLYPGLYFLKLTNEKGVTMFKRLVKW